MDRLFELLRTCGNLRESKQLAAADVKALFEYYIGCLKRHRSVVQYIRDESKGFKYLRRLLHQI